MKYIILIILLILIAGCAQTETETNNTNETYYGELLNYTFTPKSLSIDDKITINPINYTNEINIYTYCEIPFTVLKQKDNAWEHIYPFDEKCGHPKNDTFTNELTFDINKIILKDGSKLKEGKYIFKLFYSTFAPGTHMREYNEEITIE